VLDIADVLPYLLKRELVSAKDGPEVRLLERERHAVLTRALATLPDRQRRLMALIARDASYEQIEATLNMPVGSIGPTARGASPACSATQSCCG
jgi:DNA-directed RNA polymerase specialized sigma24 family protein